MSLSQRFGHLFRGRHDAYFCDYGDHVEAVREPLTEAVIQRHFMGQWNIGVYPTTDERACYWGCADIDEDDIELAMRFARYADSAGLTAWVERSKSKGFHVWVFCYEPVPAKSMRQALRLIERLAEVEIPELNPKGDGGPGVLTNCVRLPYFGTQHRQVIIDSEGERLDLEAFVDEALELRVGADGIQALADKQEMFRQSSQLRRNTVPRRRRSGGRRSTARSDTKAAQAFRGERRISVGERDDTLFALANYLKGTGFTELRALEEMNRVWETQVDDPATFALDDALKKVRRVYGSA